MAKGKFSQARILVALTFAGFALKIDDVVSGTEEQIDQLTGQGAADKHPKAVAYALSVNGNNVTDITGEAQAAADAEAAQKLADAQAAVKAAEDGLAAATTEEAKKAAQEKLDAAKTELAALG